MNTLRLVFALLVVTITVASVQAEEWIQGADLTDEHEVIDNTCGDNFFGNTWKTNKRGNINGFGLLSDDGTQCTVKNKKARTVTRNNAMNSFWVKVEDRLNAASYSSEINWPMLEEDVADYEEEYVDDPYAAYDEEEEEADYDEDSGSSYTQDDLDAAVDAAVEAALADVIDDLVTSDELAEVQAEMDALE